MWQVLGKRLRKKSLGRVGATSQGKKNLAPKKVKGISRKGGIEDF